MRIMIIDDDVQILNNYKSALIPAKYDCVTYDEPLKALKDYKKYTFDVVITDIRMPRLNGIDFIQKIRTKDKQVKIIIITGYADNFISDSAAAAEVYGILDKPIDFKDLILILRQIDKEQNLSTAIDSTDRDNFRSLL